MLVVLPENNKIKDLIRERDYSKIEDLVVNEKISFFECRMLLEEYLKEDKLEFPKESWKKSWLLGCAETVLYSTQVMSKWSLSNQLKFKIYCESNRDEDKYDPFNAN